MARSLKAQLLEQSNRLLPTWFPNGRQVGREWVVGNLRGDTGESLKINLETGIWSDFATGETGGCLISLYAAKQGVHYQKAASDLRVNAFGLRRAAKPLASWPVPADAPPLPFSVGDVWQARRKGTITAIWTYRDFDGRSLAHTMRVDLDDLTAGQSKDILPVHYFEVEGFSGWKVKGHGHSRDPIYGLERLQAAPASTVLIVEGEKAADAGASLFPDHVVISWMGGAQRIGKVDWMPLSGRKVIYWPDADDTGARSVEVLAAALPEVESFTAVQPPMTLPKGWDVADPAPEEINLKELLAAAQPVGLRELLGRLETLEFDAIVRRVAFNSLTLQFFDPVSGLRLDRTQIDSHFRHSMGPRFSDRLLSDSDLRKGLGFTYRPGISDVIVHDHQGQALINIWRGGTLEPKEGDASILEMHLRYLCSTDEEYEYLANWLAHLVQRPGEKIMCAIVLVGRQGTGKTGLTQLITEILGLRNVTVVSSNELRSDFNEWVEAKQLIIVEEIMALGRREIMNALKPLITQLRIAVNVKHQRRYEIENAANFIFLSNSPDALALENGDRRYFVVHSDAEPQDGRYYEALFRWIRENAAVGLHWLLARDLSGFDSNRPPPMTEGKAAMIEASAPPLEAVLRELIEAQAPPFDSDLIDLLPTLAALNAQGSPAAGLTVNFSALRNALRRLGAVMFGQQKGRVGGRDIRASLWSIRNHEVYAGMTSSQRITRFVSDRQRG